MADRDGLGRFQVGNPGGPGRPKKGDALTDVLNQTVDKQALADKIIELAMDGNMAAIRYIYDRLDGKPIETLQQVVSNAPDVIEIVHTGGTWKDEIHEK